MDAVITHRGPRLRLAAAVGVAALSASLLQVADAPVAQGAARPDLVVSALRAPVGAVAGARIRLRLEITNRGAAPAARSTVRLHFGLEPGLSSGRTRLGLVDVPRLAAGRSTVLTFRRRVPATTTPERYLVVACVDASSRVRERMETNNCRTYGAVTVTNRPDLYAQIDEEVATGEISRERGLIYKVYADVGDPALPDRFGPAPATLDRAAGIAEAAHRWNQLTSRTKRALAPLFTPPAYATLDDQPRQHRRGQATCLNQNDPPVDYATWASIDTDHFRFWYYTVNPDPRFNPPPSVSKAGAEQLAAIAEHVYDLETSLWRKPLSDAGVACSGGDGRIDVYLVKWSASNIAQVRPHPPGAVRRPGWAYVSPGADDLRDVFAHEFAHLIQLAYDHPDSPRRWIEYGWLEEASATWAIDYVYPGDDYEHQFDQYFTRAGHKDPLGECIETRCGNGYRDWVYFYFLTQHLGDPGVMTRIWELTETKSSVAAVNLALGGKFGELFAEFALRGLNRENYDDFRAWDGFLPGIPFGAESVPYTEVDLEGSSRHTWRLPGASTGRFLEPRSYKTDQYAFTDPDVRRVVLRDFGYRGDPASGVRIKAWYKLADGSRVTEDWTDLNRMEFCRDRADEDIQQLVLFYVHGQPREYLSLGPEEFPRRSATLKAFDRCEPAELPERWTGSASGTNTYGSITETWSASVVLKKQSWSSEHLTTYGAVPGAGTWNWSISGTTSCPGGGTRSISGSYSRAFWPHSPYDPSTTPRGEQLVLFGPDAGPLYGHSNAFHVNLNPATPEPLFSVVTLGACAGTDSEVVRSYTAMNCVRDAESEYLPYTPEMTTIAGSRSYDVDVGCGDSNPVTATWNLTAAD